MKKIFGEGLRDAVLFGRVIGAGLAVAGYAFLGVYGARWLELRGYPGWLVSAAPAAAVVFGLWQGWLFLARLTRREKEERGKGTKKGG